MSRVNAALTKATVGAEGGYRRGPVWEVKMSNPAWTTHADCGHLIDDDPTKCGSCLEIASLREKAIRFDGALRACMSASGNPHAAAGCRAVIAIARAALADDGKGDASNRNPHRANIRLARNLPTTRLRRTGVHPGVSGDYCAGGDPVPQEVAVNIPGLLRAAKENDKPHLPLPNAEVVELCELLKGTCVAMKAQPCGYNSDPCLCDVLHKLRQAGLGEG